MTTATAQPLVDVQSSHDHRDIDITKVGIRRLRYPIELATRDNGPQQTTALVNMYVSLDRSFKGTHMSRFVEILNEHRAALDIHDLRYLLADMKERLQAGDAHIELSFPFFLDRRAPVTGQAGLIAYDCHVQDELDQNGEAKTVFGVSVPVTTLCLCSKEMSDYGAHNQRSIVSVHWRCTESIWLEHMIELIESQGSAPIYSLLKRPDEKFVTEQAYDHPKFVEDMVRDITAKLREDERVVWFRVESENEESIHTHNAYALIEEERA